MLWQDDIEPTPSSNESRERVLAAARALDWPARSLDVETQPKRGRQR